MKKHLVIGMGEVGTAIQKVFDADYIDINSQSYTQSEYKILHICIPFNKDFIDTVNGYQREFNPEITIIHSTVPVGTSRKCNALHSPIRGIHPHLYEGVMTFEKFIGGEKASLVADDFRKAGLKVILCDKQETTELLKIMDTEYYRACIEFTHKAGQLCEKYDVPFHEVYTLANITYNKGYTKLGHEEYVRPVLQNIKTEIGGHCVLPNSKLI